MAASEHQWIPRIRHFGHEIAQVPRSEVLSHPLRSTVTRRSIMGAAKKKAEEEKPDFFDPLGATLGGDPLSQALDSDLDASLGPLALSPVDTGGLIPNSLREETRGPLPGEDSFLARPWGARRGQILATFTTSERLCITTSFLPGGLPLEARVEGAPDSRLAQLEDGGDGLRRVADLSQAEYVARINQLNAALLKAWSEDRRVDSVKIVIQCAKLLADVPVPSFYPSQFVLVTDILDTFGRLVFERLLSKANEELAAAGKAPLGSGSSWAERVPETTRETARNWFYKVASIREVVPRLYVEACLLRTRPFLCAQTPAFGPPDSQLRRLATMARGLSHPLVAAFARCYVGRVGARLGTPMPTDHLWLSLHDTLRGWPKGRAALEATVPESSVRKSSSAGNMSDPGYWERLMSPALDWVLSCVASVEARGDLLPLLEYAKQPPQQTLLLVPLIAALPSTPTTILQEILHGSCI